jgi:hypothetical protein
MQPRLMKGTRLALTLTYHLAEINRLTMQRAIQTPQPGHPPVDLPRGVGILQLVAPQNHAPAEIFSWGHST